MSQPLKYRINEWFYSVQGEGIRAGTANVFLRFQHCNLRCNHAEQGFDCDTEFVSGREYELDDLIGEILECGGDCRNLIFTGGEPTIQVDRPLIDTLKALGFFLAIETNGTREVPEGLDWITVSPKTAEHTIRQRKANEVKYVRSYGQSIPQPLVIADHYLVSPAFIGPDVDFKNLEWCIRLVKENPTWRLSVQQHKFWMVR